MYPNHFNVGYLIINAKWIINSKHIPFLLYDKSLLN